MEVIGFLFWIVLAVAVGAWASNKGRSGVGFFFLALLLSPLLGGIIVACLKPNEENTARAAGLKKCPACAEFCKPDALVCRFCKTQFPPPLAPVALAPPTKTNPRVVAAIVAAVVIGSALLVYISISK
jgi:hypothetical protein